MTTDAPTVMKSRGGSIQSNLLPDAPIAEKISTQRTTMTLAEKYYTYWNSKTPSERLENYYSLLDVPNKDNDEWTELLVLERLVAADVALRMGATA